jgi:hypothetical protein
MKKTTYKLNASRPKTEKIIAGLVLNKSNRVQIKNGEYIVDVYSY